MRLLLDMDGPLAGFDLHFWNRCQDQGWTFDVDGPHVQRHRFFTDHMPVLSERRKARRMVTKPGWFADLPVVEGAREGVASIMERGIDLWVCTKPLAASRTCATEKIQWLDRHFPELGGKLIIAPDKSVIHGDALLDDAPKVEWLDRAPWKPVIFATSYNGEGSAWEGLPRWTWGDDLSTLLSFMC